jgi:hypothetical protein
MTTIAIFYIVDREIRSSTVEKKFIFAFPWAKWLHERATILHYMYVGLSCMQCKVFISLLTARYTTPL